MRVDTAVVGSSSTPHLIVEDGGKLVSARGFIGRGHMMVSGVDAAGNPSVWESPRLVVNGPEGASLLVEGGGKVISEAAYVSQIFSSTSAATVEGRDAGGQASVWDIGARLDVGYSGLGTLALRDGGTMVGTRLVLGAGGGRGTLLIGAAATDAPVDPGELNVARLAFGTGQGRLVFNHTGDDYEFSVGMTSTEGHPPIIDHISGETVLNGNSSGFTGTTNVSGGALVVANKLGGTVSVTGGSLVVDGSFLGDITAKTGGILSGAGTIGGGVSLTEGAMLAGAQGQTLTIADDLTLDARSQVNVALGGAPAATLFDVGGHLTLDGMLHITDQGGFGTGVYRLFDHDGQLTDNGLDIGNVPAGADRADLFVQTAVPGQVNLVSNQGTELGFWDGGNPGRHDNGTVDGGAGLWRADGRNWTEADGAVNGPYRPNPTFAVFQGRAGTVSVDGAAGAIGVSGMQFATDGYRMEGAAIALEGAGGESIIRVGDGTAAGRAITATVASALTGDTQLVKTDRGTLVLEGSNSYSGGTRIDDGVLSISSDASLGAASGKLILNGGTLAATSDIVSGRAITLAATGIVDVGMDNTLRLDGVIGGANNLRKTGEGALVLTGANTYADTVVEAGTLMGDVEAIRGDIANAGTIVFDQSADASFAGMISARGGMKGAMVKGGSGELTLTGSSALDWTVEAGSLTSTAERFAGNVKIGTAGIFTFEQAIDSTYAGRIAGTGSFNKIGTGMLFYDGKSPDFAGTATVGAGTLIVGSEVAYENAVLGGSLQVLDGATLGGHGTVGSGSGSVVTLAQGGRLSPGNSIGTLTVNGNLVVQPGASFLVEVDPGSTDGDLVHVTGDATLNGGAVIQVGPEGNFQPSAIYTILAVDGTLSGRFDSVRSGFAFLDADLAYDYAAGTIGLELERNDVDFAADAVTRNQIATANAVESIRAAAQSPVYHAVLQLPDDPAVIQAGLDQLSGEIHASAQSVLMQNSHFLRDAVAGRLRAAFGGVAAPTSPVMAYEGGAVKALPADTERGAFWAYGFGSWGGFAGTGNAASVNNDVGGVFMGADAPVLESWRLGVMAGYSSASFDIDDRSSSGDGTDWHVGLYGGTQQGPVGVRLGLAYTWSEIETARAVAIPGFSDQLNGDYDAGTFQAFGDVGYRIDLGVASFEPFAGLAYVSVDTDGFTEQGGAAALSAAGQDMETTFTTLGLRASTALSLGSGDVVLSGALGWRHAFGDVVAASTLVFAGSENFTVAGVPIAEDAAVVEAGLAVSLSEAATLGLAYQGQFGGGVTQNGFNAALSVKF
ncbi:outer membrane autotransporter protein [Ancylobacter sp. 3268]|uniref:autotransporter domain-containing protein n=1 Tax=Ancylobacter sp. 3268 TaxID=2817752 RepID=UPI0028606612|nr:autotransporter domain-containing protein [Ancylobacter sp. 3268]MDR6954619.1 outer membrane autotransporter protein [Ancylobacter sp. 3268]